VLATEWAVRAYDRAANLLWKTRLAAVAWAVNVSPDGRFAVAALSDGTLRWYRMTDGEETAAFFPHANGQDWIAWVPSGHYVSSLYGDRHVGWLLNRGKDAAPDFFRAVQFERVLRMGSYDELIERLREKAGPVARAEATVASASAVRRPGSARYRELAAVAALRAGRCEDAAAGFVELLDFAIERANGPALVRDCWAGVPIEGATP